MNNAIEFEIEVLTALNEALHEGRLGLLPDRCKVFQGKGYYSREREKKIVTDVSVEIFVEEVGEPAILWIWECKRYKRNVPVDDVEEFHAKLEQLGADRTKGTMIVRGAFQESALRFAIAKGIGLARLVERRQIRWLRPASGGFSPEERFKESLKALSDPAFAGRDGYLYAVTTAGLTESTRTFLGYCQLELETWLEKRSSKD